MMFADTNIYSFLLDLAPNGVCHALSVTTQAVRSYRTISPLLHTKRDASGIFSVALSVGYGTPCIAMVQPIRPAVSRHCCSAEFGLSSVLLSQYEGEAIPRLPAEQCIPWLWKTKLESFYEAVNMISEEKTKSLHKSIKK